jgi:hypothetical protein
VQFSRDLRERVADGAITLTVRLWSRPQVKVGGRYQVLARTIEVDDVDLVPFSSITRADMKRAGEADREAMRLRVAHAGPVDDDTPVYRIEFHLVD